MYSGRSIYHTVIVGAGPAGSIAAYYLSNVRLRVLLLDENKFPRDKVCGDALTSKALKFLEEMGITLEILKSMGGIFVRQYRYFREGREIERVFKPGIGLRRLILDDMLLQQAVYAGAEVKEEARVIHVTQSNGVFAIHTKAGEVFYSHTVLLACGAQCAFSLNLDGFISVRPSIIRNKAIGVRSYFRSPSVHNSQEFKFFYLSNIQRGYGWIFPVEENLFNVGIWASSISNVKKVFWKFIQEIALLHLPTGVEMVNQPQGAMIGIRPRIFSNTPGLFLAGDIAHTADPTSGEGIFWALQSGKAAAMKIINSVGSNW